MITDDSYSLSCLTYFGHIEKIGLAQHPIAGQPIAKKDMKLKAGPLNWPIVFIGNIFEKLRKKKGDPKPAGD